MAGVTAKILTVPETIREEMLYFPVGNEWIALPELNQWGQVESFNVISEHHKGMVEFRGQDEPLLAPFLSVQGQRVGFSQLKWDRLDDWIPHFQLLGEDFRLEGTIFCPRWFPGFCLSPPHHQHGSNSLSFTLGWQASWENTAFTAFRTRRSLGHNVGWYNRWTRTLTLNTAQAYPRLPGLLGSLSL